MQKKSIIIILMLIIMSVSVLGSVPQVEITDVHTIPDSLNPSSNFDVYVTCKDLDLNGHNNVLFVRTNVYVNDGWVGGTIGIPVYENTPTRMIGIPSTYISLGDTIKIHSTCQENQITSYDEIDEDFLYKSVGSTISYVQPEINDSDFVFLHASTNITINFMTTNNVGVVIPLESPIGLETFFTEQANGGIKYAYELFLPNQNFVSVNRISSSAPITMLSEYDFTLGNEISLSYLDAVLEGFNVNITYNESIVPIHTIDVRLFKDYKGASRLYIDPEVCVPNWQPSSYNPCQINNSKQAVGYVDLNDCGLSYNGTFNWYDCDYCTPNWICSVQDDTLCPESRFYECIATTDSNDCFATTGLLTDLLGNSTDNVQGDFCSKYGSEDMDDIAGDVVGTTGVEIIKYIPLIILILVGIFMFVRFKKIK